MFLRWSCVTSIYRNLLTTLSPVILVHVRPSGVSSVHFHTSSGYLTSLDHIHSYSFFFFIFSCICPSTSSFIITIATVFIIITSSFFPSVHHFPSLSFQQHPSLSPLPLSLTSSPSFSVLPSFPLPPSFPSLPLPPSLLLYPLLYLPLLNISLFLLQLLASATPASQPLARACPLQSYGRNTVHLHHYQYKCTVHFTVCIPPYNQLSVSLSVSLSVLLSVSLSESLSEWLSLSKCYVTFMKPELLKTDEVIYKSILHRYNSLHTQKNIQTYMNIQPC